MTFDVSKFQAAAPEPKGGSLIASQPAPSAYLPRVALMYPLSGPAKSNPAWINSYVATKAKDDHQLLGETVQALVLDTRDKAIVFQPELKESFEFGSDLFQEIIPLADRKEDAQYGVEVLLYVQNLGFATIFLASKSARNTAPAFEQNVRQYATLGSKEVENKKGQSWRIPTVTQSPTMFEITESEEAVVTQLEKFQKPVPVQDRNKEEEKEDDDR